MIDEQCQIKLSSFYSINDELHLFTKTKIPFQQMLGLIGALCLAQVFFDDDDRCKSTFFSFKTINIYTHFTRTTRNNFFSHSYSFKMILSHLISLTIHRFSYATFLHLLWLTSFCFALLLLVNIAYGYISPLFPSNRIKISQIAKQLNSQIGNFHFC